MYFTVLYNSVYIGMAALISVYLARFSLKSELVHGFYFGPSIPVYVQLLKRGKLDQKGTNLDRKQCTVICLE